MSLKFIILIIICFTLSFRLNASNENLRICKTNTNNNVTTLSTDGGETWSFATLNGYCRNIVKTNENGTYNSYDGGETWYKIRSNNFEENLPVLVQDNNDLIIQFKEIQHNMNFQITSLVGFVTQCGILQNSKTFEFDLSKFNCQILFVTLFDNKGFMQTYKFVVAR